MATLIDNGVIVHHPSVAPGARAAWTRLAVLLATRRPGYLLWCLRTDPAPVLAHAGATAEGARFEVVPLLIVAGKHFDEEVRVLAKLIRDLRRDLDVSVRPPLLDDPRFVAAWVEGLGQNY